jgi:phosphatidylglycerol:prolipoprotein diacylglycerol transferase
MRSRCKADGQVGGFYLTFYSAGRFILEFFRGDLERGEIGPLSTSQFIAIFTFLIGIAIIVICGMHPRKAVIDIPIQETDVIEKEDNTREASDDLFLTPEEYNSEEVVIELLKEEEKE